ncbi:MAG: hypothetical protein ACRC5C_02945 [Bacilli bacterium]
MIKTTIRNGTEYRLPLDDSIASNPAFRLCMFNHTFPLPDNLRGISDIIRITCEERIENCRTFKTPVGQSVDGTIITGNKAWLVGELSIRLEYVSPSPPPALYNSTISVPFHTLVPTHANFHIDQAYESYVHILDLNVYSHTNRVGALTILAQAGITTFAASLRTNTDFERLG